jgi:hypothetical protein
VGARDVFCIISESPTEITSAEAAGSCLIECVYFLLFLKCVIRSCARRAGEARKRTKVGTVHAWILVRAYNSSSASADRPINLFCLKTLIPSLSPSIPEPDYYF